MTTYAEWKKKYFFKGKTLPIYFTFVNFLIFSAFLVYFHANLYIVIFSFIGAISSYAVFTDLYAHLWTPQSSGLTLKQWLVKLISLRTHDIYGLAFTIIAIGGLISLIPLLILVICFVLAVLSIYCIVKSRFYH
jgi:hypothetical protein